MSLNPEKCAELIKSSKSTVALTGAGISTAAGIPDFRGPKGMYVTRQYDPDKVFSLDWFENDPTCFYEFSKDFTGTLKTLKPTYTHHFLSRLEEKNMLSAIITQNIDILHQLAGSRNVLELHGSYRSATCRNCRGRLHDMDYDWWCEQIETSSASPVVLCQKCGGVIKPDIVFFGEAVNAFGEANDLVSSCDLLLVLGSSLNVAPASLLPRYTTATTVVVNKGAVMLPAASQRFFVDDTLDEYFAAVEKYL